jgi:hypothetical protein
MDDRHKGTAEATRRREIELTLRLLGLAVLQNAAFMAIGLGRLSLRHFCLNNFFNCCEIAEKPRETKVV